MANQIGERLNTAKDPRKKEILSSQNYYEGWMLKKGSKSFSGWKKRYFKLNRNKQLAYYADDKSIQNKGNISLRGLREQNVNTSSKASDSKHYGFVPPLNPSWYTSNTHTTL